MHPSRSRQILTALLGLLAVVLTGVVVTAPSATAAVTDIKINEVRSDGIDTVELVNNGSATIDVSGFVFSDDDDTHSFALPAGSTIAAGGHLAFDVTAFGLGKGDSARIYAPDGSTLLDSTTWPAGTHANTWGRCPDGSGPFQAMTASFGAANACQTPDGAVRINEFSSNSPDFIELINTGTGPVDLSGWMLKDNSENNSYTFPAGSSIAGGAILPLSGEGVQFVFGLGGGDSVRLFNSGGTAIDSHVYPAHPPAGKSYGRCPDGTGAFVVTSAATKGSANSCPLPAGANDVKINEVRSDPDDIVELVNTGSAPVAIGGYLIKDNDDTHVFAIPAGTTLAAGAFTTFDVNPSFGLGKGDSARLYTPDGATLLDSTTWPADTHATTWGRCPDGSGSFGTRTATLGGPNACGSTPPATPEVTINEVESNGDQVADWVELRNNGATVVDVSGWKIIDGDPDHAATPVLVPSGTTIPAGGYYALYTEIAQSPGFGLGVGDSVTLYLPNGTTLVDTTTWGAHPATTWGRCPDGTGAFRETTTPTRGLTNACSPIRINEVESSGGTPGDWIELKNISGAAVDLSGWSVKDSGESPYTIPSGTSIGANGYLVLDEAQLGFGLGGADAVRLYDASSTLIESYSWATAAAQTYGRCKDGVGSFVDTKAPTKGAANSCPGLDTQPWPGGQTVSPADLTGTFVQDLSGLAFDPADPDVLWAAQNKKGTLFKLLRDVDGNFVPAPGWPRDPKFADGTGSPDSEGITIGPDGFVYLTSERDNGASGVSRNTVLRFDPNAPAGATITPTTEWNLTPLLPSVGANLGIEGVTFVPDSSLTSQGFVDQSTNAPYSPSTYPNHGSGLFFVALENDGQLYAFALDSDGTAHKVATIASGFPALADVSWDPELQRLRAVTDDTVDGRTSLLAVGTDGSFAVDVAYDRPAGMPNLNNEGLAVAPQSRCVGGLKEVVWADDGDTDGHSIRRGTIRCTALQTITFTSTAPTAAVVGDTYQVSATGGGSGNPVQFAIDVASLDTCSIAGDLVRADHAGTCVVRAAQAAAPGYAAGTAMQTFTIGKAPQTITFAQPGGTVYGGAHVALSASSDSGLPVALTSETPAVCSVSGTAAVPLAAGTCTIEASQSGNGDFAAATSVTRSLTVAKAPVVVTTRSTSGLVSLLTLKITYTSTVKSAVTGLPVAGVPVTTRINGGYATSGCTATSNASGVATCTVGPVAIALGVHYTATAAATANTLGGTGTAFIGLF